MKIFREKKKGSIRALGGLEQEAGHADADCRGVQETDAALTDIEHGILVHHLFLSCTVELPLRLTFLYMKGRTPGAKMVQDASRPVRYNNN